MDEALVCHVGFVVDGRSAATRAPTVRKLAATAVQRLYPAEVSLKARTGDPVDDPDDQALPH